MAMSFLGNLAIFGGATNQLLDNNVVPVVAKAIETQMEYPGLVAKMIRILANMVYSEEKAKKAVKDVNGEEIVKVAMMKHAAHTQLQKVDCV